MPIPWDTPTEQSIAKEGEKNINTPENVLYIACVVIVSSDNINK